MTSMTMPSIHDFAPICLNPLANPFVPRGLNPLANEFLPVRLIKKKYPKLTNPKIHKNNKNKKLKTSFTRHRSLDRAIKASQNTHGTEDTEETEGTEDTLALDTLAAVATAPTLDTIETTQISQIYYHGSIYEMDWDSTTNRVLITIPNDDLDYSHKNLVIHDDICFVSYNDATIHDIILLHFGTVDIIPDNYNSSNELYRLISSLPLTQYTLVN
jgi:hypothetical protein